VKAYLLKLDGRDEGPFSDTQIAQMFADQRVNRSTPCKPESGGDWRTVDEYLPMLKYGTERPARTTNGASRGMARSTDGGGIRITDIDVPFRSVLKMAFKVFAAWLIVLVCFVPVIILFWVIFAAVIMAALGGLAGLQPR
jgi:hypothetical protein